MTERFQLISNDDILRLSDSYRNTNTKQSTKM